MRRYVIPFLLLTWLATVLAALGQSSALTAADDTAFQVRNRKFGDLLRPRNASNRNGEPIVLYPRQPWRCMIWHFNEAGPDKFRLKNDFTSKSFGAASADGADRIPLQQVPCAADAHDAPVWVFRRVSDGVYRIGPPDSELALTAERPADGQGFRVILAPWRDSDEQKWELLKAPENPTM